MVQGTEHNMQLESEEKENIVTVDARNVVYNYGNDDNDVEINMQQQQSQYYKTSNSLLKSSPTALAKFNRIIDATVPTTNVYQTLQQPVTTATATKTTLALQERIALAYRNIVSTDSTTTTTATSETITTLTLKTQMEKEAELESADDNYLYNKNKYDNNNMKRNDVHYLLKQLNSFSDIEEIEIGDNMQQQIKRQRQQSQQQNLQHEQPQQQDMEKYSPTTQSLVLLSPSSLSHKGIRRYASLHQQQTEATKEREMVASSLSQQFPQTAAQYYYTTMAGGSGSGSGGVGVQQFDDYLFQSCHYLETNYFAANYRTAMVESNSHEFRPSITTTTTGTMSASYSSHSSLHTFDLHETEPPSVICKAPLSSPLPPLSLQQSYEKDEEIIEAEQEQLHPYATYAQLQPPALGPPARRFQMQARLTSSGVQTELTASSLSTNASLAKSSTILSQHTTSTSSSEVRSRRKPFFKCCYTPIDRWRERRTERAAAVEAQQQQQQQKRPTELCTSSSNSEAANRRKQKEKEAAAGSAV